LALDSRRGFDLNCRLGVNGSQNASMSERLKGAVAFMSRLGKSGGEVADDK
jgi:hypothetical protein